MTQAAREIVHQFQDAFADFEQLLARLGNHLVRQQFFRRDGFQSRLRFVQVIERAFQIRDGEGIVAIAAAMGNAVQRAASFTPVV